MNKPRCAAPRTQASTISLIVMTAILFAVSSGTSVADDVCRTRAAAFDGLMAKARVAEKVIIANAGAEAPRNKDSRARACRGVGTLWPLHQQMMALNDDQCFQRSDMLADTLKTRRSLAHSLVKTSIFNEDLKCGFDIPPGRRVFDKYNRLGLL